MRKIRLIQISDLHFGTVLPGVQTALIKSIREQKPDLIIMSGDITQRARSAEFIAADNFKKMLAEFSVIAIPGNHDIPLFNLFARFLWPYYGFTQLFNHRLEETWEHDDVKIAMFNSTSKYRHVQGSLNPERLKNQFPKPKTENGIRIIGFHHPMDCAKNIDDKNLLVNRADLIQTCHETEIDLILGGHIHDPFTNLSSERYPSLPRPMIITVAGTSLSWRTRANAPNSYQQIDIESGITPEIEVSRFDLNQESEFRFKEKSVFKRTQKIWTKAT